MRSGYGDDLSEYGQCCHLDCNNRSHDGYCYTSACINPRYNQINGTIPSESSGFNGKIPSESSGYSFRVYISGGLCKDCQHYDQSSNRCHIPGEYKVERYPDEFCSRFVRRNNDPDYGIGAYS